MTDPNLAARLDRLERSHRRLRRLVGALLAALAGGLLLAAGDGDTLRGTRLELRDAEGRVRLLATAASGLSLLDERGRPRAVLAADAASGPSLALTGDAGRAIVNVNADGPALTLTGERGALRAVLAAVKGDPGLVLYDAAERERLALAVTAGHGQGVLRDAAGAVTWSAPAAD